MKRLNYISAIAFSSLLVACATTEPSVKPVATSAAGIPMMVTYTLNDGKDWKQVSAGLLGWGDGVAEFKVMDEQAHVRIKQKASNEWNIQLKRPLYLLEGMRYEITVEASADAPSNIAFVVQQSEGKYETYFRQVELLSTQPETFTYQFTMPKDEINAVFAIMFGNGKPGVNFNLRNIKFTSVY
ncbi:carbohydrate binding domain-containing protein [Agarivorans sp.]|uniref:carbohydrate binding domain-containing protein n=1 Tax=Agarivorans sp. TaxID=1872412 RepID=UPI003D08B364